MDFNIPENFIEFTYGWQKNIDFDKESKLFLEELNRSNKENDIQKYIKENNKWFIPASIFEDYDFGHHEAYLVSEQSLGSEYRVDYMLIGRNSIGHHIILVEFEDVNVDFKLKNSMTETNPVRKGLSQIREWKIWIDNNKRYFFDSCGLSDIRKNIPSWEIWYYLVVSRRSRMDDDANELRRLMHSENIDVKIVTYDRLADNVKKLSNGF